jgi:hypothetical protein
VEREEFWL